MQNIPKNKFECKNCKKKKIPDLQVIPEVFNMYEPLMNHDIGTILIYTCNCNIKLSEEHVFVQRTGDKILDLGKIKDIVKFKGMLIDTSTIKKIVELEEIKEEENGDADGFIEVKKGKIKICKQEINIIKEKRMKIVGPINLNNFLINEKKVKIKIKEHL